MSIETRGHDRRGRPAEAVRWGRANAGSSLHTTARDYARFLKYILADHAEDFARAIEPVVPVEPSLRLAWGYGWALGLHPGRGPLTFHWGSNPGFKSFALADPVKGLGAMILTNGDHGLELIDELFEILDPVEHSLFEFYMMHPDD